MKVVEVSGRSFEIRRPRREECHGIRSARSCTRARSARSAIIAEISLKLRAKFARTATAVARFRQSESAPPCIAVVRKSTLQPVSCEWTGPENEVWLRFGEHPRAVDWQLKNLPPGADWIILEGADESAAWERLAEAIQRIRADRRAGRRTADTGA